MGRTQRTKITEPTTAVETIKKTAVPRTAMVITPEAVVTILNLRCWNLPKAWAIIAYITPSDYARLYGLSRAFLINRLCAKFARPGDYRGFTHLERSALKVRSRVRTNPQISRKDRTLRNRLTSSSF